jgi:farnesyl diphosphate synthase
MPDLSDRLKENGERIAQMLDDLLPRPQGAEARLMQAIRYAALGGG